MKKILFCLLLIPSFAFAFDWNGASVSGINGATVSALNGTSFTSGPITCTGGLTFYWPVNSTATDITVDGGCSVGDYTATAVSVATITSSAPGGGYALDLIGTGSYTFDVASSDLFTEQQGTLIYDVYFAGSSLGTPHITLFGSTTAPDKIFLIQNSATAYKFGWKGSGSSTVYNTDAVIAANTWHTIKVTWEVGGSQTLTTTIDDGTPVTTTTSLQPSWSESPYIIYLGSDGSSIPQTYIRNIKIYNTVQ